MVLSRRLVGQISDSQCIEEISSILDSADAVVIALDMTRPQDRTDGEDKGGDPER